MPPTKSPERHRIVITDGAGRSRVVWVAIVPKRNHPAPAPRKA